MQKHKTLRVLKDAATYFSTAAGAASLVIGLVALAIFVPPFVSIPIIVGVGGLFAFLGGRRKWKRLVEEQAEEDVLEVERQKIKREHEEQLVISRSLDKKLADIAEAERKIQFKLEEFKTRHERQQRETQVVSHAVRPSMRRWSLSDSQSRVISRERSSFYRPRVTIRINNLPTFFTVERSMRRGSKSRSQVWAAIGNDGVSTPSLRHRASVS